MDFFGIGVWEFLLIGIIALTIFGPKQLILFARKAGEYTRKLQIMWAESMRVITAEVDAIEKEMTEVKTELNSIAIDLQKETNQIGTQIRQDVNQINQTVTENTRLNVEAATTPTAVDPAPPATPDAPLVVVSAPADGHPESAPANPVRYPAWTEASDRK